MQHEKHEMKKDPDHALRHKMEEKVAMAVASTSTTRLRKPRRSSRKRRKLHPSQPTLTNLNPLQPFTIPIYPGKEQAPRIYQTLFSSLCLSLSTPHSFSLYSVRLSYLCYCCAIQIHNFSFPNSLLSHPTSTLTLGAFRILLFCFSPFLF